MIVVAIPLEIDTLPCELEHWCADNCRADFRLEWGKYKEFEHGCFAGGRSIPFTEHAGKAHFVDENDAVLFKLRWSPI